MNCIDKKVLAMRLKELRAARNVTQSQLAIDTGMSISSIINYENALREPNSRAMAALEQYFGVSGAYLRGESDERDTIYMWGDSELMETLKSGLSTLFKVVLEATATCSDKDQKMVFNIMVELRHILSSSSISKEQRSASVELLQEMVSLSTQFVDAYVHGNAGGSFESSRIAKVKQSCVKDFERALLLAEENMNTNV